MTDQPDVTAQPVQGTPPGTPLESAADKIKKKRNKVRSAWISFVGRIVAQAMGAAATVALGLIVVRHYGIPEVAPAGGGKDESGITAATRVVSTGAHSIAVLPLETYAGPARQELADAMTEAVIADLARTKDLRVISRTSSMQYRSNRKTLPVIGRELAVDMILEGSITTHGDRVRIIAQLIDARSDEHIWTGSYDRSMKDVLALQADVAGAIAKGVQEALKGMPGMPGADGKLLSVTVPKPVSTSGSSPSSGGESPSGVSPARPVQ
jgi:TolB-like protein